MKKEKSEYKTEKRLPLFLSIILVFCILGGVVFSVSRKIVREMSEAAIQNLNENLNLIKSTIESIWSKDAEFQKLMALEIAGMENPQEYVLSYQRNETMVKLSLIPAGEQEGISSTGEVFSEEGMEFVPSRVMGGLEVSRSYVNYMEIGRAHV